MLPEQQNTLTSCLKKAVTTVLPDAQPTIVLERPKVATHGDLATNVAMQLAKPAQRNPRELAQAIVDALMSDPDATAIIAQYPRCTRPYNPRPDNQVSLCSGLAHALAH